MKQRYILIVDGNESIRTALRTAYSKLRPGDHVVTVADGLEAIGKLEQQQFDLVLTDFDLPGFNGFELAYIIRQTSSQTRVFLMSNDDLLTLIGHNRGGYLDGFLQKPFHASKVIPQLLETH